MPFRFRLRGPAHLERPAATRVPDVRSQQRDCVPLQFDDGRNVDVLRVRDPRARRIKLSVSERGVRLTLPQRASLVAGDRFLSEHRDWLRAQLDQLVNADDAALRRDESDSLPLRGDALPLCWERGRFTTIRHDGGAQVGVDRRQRLRGEAVAALHAAAVVVELRRTLPFGIPVGDLLVGRREPALDRAALPPCGALRWLVRPIPWWCRCEGSATGYGTQRRRQPQQPQAKQSRLKRTRKALQ